MNSNVRNSCDIDCSTSSTRSSEKNGASTLTFCFSSVDISHDGTTTTGTTTSTIPTTPTTIYSMLALGIHDLELNTKLSKMSRTIISNSLY